jgi:hypothetical protein
MPAEPAVGVATIQPMPALTSLTAMARATARLRIGPVSGSWPSSSQFQNRYALPPLMPLIDITGSAMPSAAARCMISSRLAMRLSRDSRGLPLLAISAWRTISCKDWPLSPARVTIWRPVQERPDRHPAGGDRAVGASRPRRRGGGDHRDRAVRGAARLRPGVPRRACHRGAAPDGGAGRHGAARRRGKRRSRRARSCPATCCCCAPATASPPMRGCSRRSTSRCRRRR